MKVKDLIAQLEAYDDEQEVSVIVDLGNSHEVLYVCETDGSCDIHVHDKRKI
jgi:hypothetical protein